MFLLRTPDARRTSHESIFSPDDIREIVLEFPPPTFSNLPDTDGKNVSPRLIRPTSGHGLIQLNAIASRIETALHDVETEVEIQSLASRFDVPFQVVAKNVDENPAFLYSTNRAAILGRARTRAIIECLVETTKTEFVNVDDFMNKQGVHRASVPKLLALLRQRAKAAETAEVCVIDPARDLLGPGSKFQTQSYFYSATSWATYRDFVQDIVKAAIDSESTQMLVGDTLRPLSAPALYALAAHWIGQLDSCNDCRLAFDGAAYPRVVPLKHLTKKRDLDVLALTSGKTPYMSLLNWENSLIVPTLFESRQHAADYLSDIRLSAAETSEPITIPASHYVLSKAYLDEVVSNCSIKWQSVGVVDLGATMAVFPEDLRNKVISILQERLTQQLMKSAYTKDDIVCQGTFVFRKSWLDTLTTATINAARSIAERQWKDRSTLKRHIDLSDVQPTLPEQYASYMSCVDAIWNSPSSAVNLANIGQRAFDQRFLELEDEDGVRFAGWWKDKVAVKFALYYRGLKALEDMPLKDQLADLLNEHLSRELVPSMHKRVVEQRLCRNDRVIKAMQKLVDKLKASKSVVTTIQETEKFQQKLGMEEVTVADCAAAKDSEVKSWYHTFQSDRNDARCFICAVLVLLSVNHDGLLYATAKFAPKLLRMIRPSISESAYLTLEKMKDEVKAGKVQRQTKEQVAAILSETLGTSSPAH